jgi:hypothetical protein
METIISLFLVDILHPFEGKMEVAITKNNLPPIWEIGSVERQR